MVDPHLQERFARRCTDAAFGYTAAATAAYAAFADQVFDFWADILTPPAAKKKPKTATTAFGFPVPVRQESPANPLAPFFWPMAPQPQSLQASFPLAGFPLPGFPLTGFAGYPFAAPAPQKPYQSPYPNAYQNPFQLWLGMFPLPAMAIAQMMTPPIGPPMVWPMAFMMIASGVPRSVAWPTAEANAAAMDAADAAAVSVRQVFSSYRTDGGHSTSRVPWPSEQMMTVATLLPLSFASLLAGLRVA